MTEKNLLNELCERGNEFVAKEKPIHECSFIIAGDSEKYKATLLWKKSKVMYFSADNRDIYEKVMDSDWTCFCGDDETINADTILNAIGGE